MSYARWSEDSSVYVFLSTDGELECCGCGEYDQHNAFETTAGMIAHLTGHVAAGDLVPDRCWEWLIRDQADNDAWMATMAAERRGKA